VGVGGGGVGGVESERGCGVDDGGGGGGRGRGSGGGGDECGKDVGVDDQGDQTGGRKSQGWQEVGAGGERLAHAEGGEEEDTWNARDSGGAAGGGAGSAEGKTVQGQGDAQQGSLQGEGSVGDLDVTFAGGVGGEGGRDVGLEAVEEGEEEGVISPVAQGQGQQQKPAWAAAQHTQLAEQDHQEGPQQQAQQQQQQQQQDHQEGPQQQAQQQQQQQQQQEEEEEKEGEQLPRIVAPSHRDPAPPTPAQLAQRQAAQLLATLLADVLDPAQVCGCGCGCGCVQEFVVCLGYVHACMHACMRECVCVGVGVWMSALVWCLVHMCVFGVWCMCVFGVWCMRVYMCLGVGVWMSVLVWYCSIIYVMNKSWRYCGGGSSPSLLTLPSCKCWLNNMRYMHSEVLSRQ